MVKHERRQLRSQDPDDAALLYLDAIARDRGLSAIALANSDGLLLFGSLGTSKKGKRARGRLDLEELAAVSPLVCRNFAPEHLLSSVAGDEPLHAARIMLHGETVYLSVVGGRPPPIPDTSAALDRIFGPTARAA